MMVGGIIPPRTAFPAHRCASCTESNFLGGGGGVSNAVLALATAQQTAAPTCGLRVTLTTAARSDSSATGVRVSDWSGRVGRGRVRLHLLASKADRLSHSDQLGSSLQESSFRTTGGRQLWDCPLVLSPHS